MGRLAQNVGIPDQGVRNALKRMEALGALKIIRTKGGLKNTNRYRMAAALLDPVTGDRRLNRDKQSRLDRLYFRVIDDLDTLLRAVGLKAAA